MAVKIPKIPSPSRDTWGLDRRIAYRGSFFPWLAPTPNFRGPRMAGAFLLLPSGQQRNIPTIPAFRLPCMPSKNAGYLYRVDELVEQTQLNVVLSHYGLPLPEATSGEYRMNCVFNAACAESKYGQLTVNLSDPAKVIYCHTCEVRGNLLVLIHGLEQHRPPHGGRLRGAEFTAAIKKLRDINGVVAGNPPSPSRVAPSRRRPRRLKNRSNETCRSA
jgi:hypothetical protein